MPTKDEMLKFAVEIENLVSKTDYNHIEAVIEYCKKTGLELDVAASLVNSNLKAKIESDAMALNMLKEQSTQLPF